MIRPASTSRGGRPTCVPRARARRCPSIDLSTTIIALQFGERGDDREHGAPHGRARVEALAVAHELDAQRLELVECRHEVAHAASEPIEAIDEDNLERALPRSAHQAIELRSMIASAAHAVIDELGDNFKLAPRGVLAQHVELHLRALPRQRRYPGVDRGAHHHGIFGRHQARTPP